MNDVLSACTGRIVYFEPNEIFGNDNQPVNQEDLTKYVDLSVRIPSRFYNGGGRRIYDSVLKGTPFEERNDGYTKFYLTDNYVNMSYTEFGSNGEVSTGELFGIESINISFDVQFFPQVVINFIDIKGMGLMSTMEYNYEQGKVNNLTAKSFFTSLFNFPYPIFTLEVKGYYGKSMSFDLTLKDFHTAFDSTTGNFRTTVSFIGHLYGVYGDIPMSYLMASPYFDYIGKERDASVKDELLGETWKKIGDTTIPTYIGFLKKYEEIVKGKDLGGEGYNTIGETQELEAEKLKLESVQNIYEGIIEYARLFADGHCTKDNSQIFEFTSEFTDSDKLINKKTNVKQNDFFKQDVSLVILFKNNEDKNGLQSIIEYGGELVYYVYKTEFEGELDNNYKITVTEALTEFYVLDDEIYYTALFSDIFDKLNNVKKRIATINTQIQKMNEDINSALVSVVSEKLGFKPCIKNVYQMIFKHLDCFSRQFFTVIKEVKPNRTKDTFGLSNGFFTDVDKYEDNGVIPPFPMFAQEVNDEHGKHKKIIYPGIIDTFFDQPEVKMVENIYDSLDYFIDKTYRTTKDIETALIEQKNGRKINLKIGTLFADLDESIDINKKNYYAISDMDNGIEKARYIRDIFLSRLNTYGRLHYRIGDDEASLNSFNDIESKLVYSSNPYIDEDTLRNLINIGNFDLYSEFKRLSGSSTIGFVNYNSEIGRDVSNYENDLKIHIADNNDLKTIARILKKGDYRSCKSMIESLQIDESYKFTFPDFIFDNKGFDVNLFKLNKWHRSSVYKTVDVFDDDNDCDDVCSAGSFWVKSGNETNWALSMDVDFLLQDTLFCQDSYSNQLPLFDWACNEYDKKYFTLSFCQNTILNRDYWYGWNDGFYGDVYEYDSESYKTTYPTRVTQNRIVVISLGHLLAIGEMFYESWRNTNNLEGSYFVPFTKLDSRSDVKSHNVKYYHFAKFFKPHSKKFGELTIGLYKTFYNLKPTSQDQEYYNHFVDSSDGVIKGDIKDACTKWYVIGKEVINTNNYSFSPCNPKITDKKVKEVWNNFIDNLFNLYGVERSIVESKKTKEEAETQILELKTNIYYTLKTLYDKWYSGLNDNFFNMYKLGEVNEDSEFNKVSYLTTTFNDISESLIIDIESFSNQIMSIRKDASDAQRSVLSYMAKTAQDNQSTFLVLPTNIFNENLQDAFKTYSFYNGTLKHDKHGSTYVVMYNGDVSHNLDNPNSQYEQDGYDIASYHDGVLKISETALNVTNIASHVASEHDYTLQAFGVTYGMQNQNIFKNISVDTQTPQITDYSITNMLTIAEQGSELADGGKSLVKTQSLYPVYANRSYNCSVEMMGCMNITPLMYFQLNNIPMFRGAYMITNVEHKITANDFTTTFTGVRVSKYNIPINSEVINLSRVGSILNDDNTFTRQETPSSNVDNTRVKPYINTSVIIDTSLTSNDVVNLDKEGKYWMPYKGIDESCNPNSTDCNNAARSSAQNVMRGLINEDYLLYKHLENIDACSLAQGGSSSNSILLLKEGMKMSTNNTYVPDTTEKNIYYFLNPDETPRLKYLKATEVIKSHLNKGIPIRVGVNHTFDITNRNEGTTDHFITIYGYGIFEGENKPLKSIVYTTPLSLLGANVEYYRYYENGSSDGTKVVNKNNILIYVDQDKPLFFGWSEYMNCWYDVTLISPYTIDGKILNNNLQLNNYTGTYIDLDDENNIKCPRDEYEKYKHYYS